MQRRSADERTFGVLGPARSSRCVVGGDDGAGEAARETIGDGEGRYDDAAS